MDLRAPLYLTGQFGEATSLLVAFVIGLAFGFFIERGGLGNARKLAGQFYLRDFAVFKVMFTAIVTALLGLFWLSRLGWLDLALVAVSPSYLLPQLVGGLLFGVGFVMAGLCPGTACVAIATGKLDGIFVLLGIGAGLFAYAELFSTLHRWLYISPLGRITLPDAIGLPHGLIVLGVVTLALGGFIGASALEKRARARGAEGP